MLGGLFGNTHLRTLPSKTQKMILMETQIPTAENERLDSSADDRLVMFTPQACNRMANIEDTII